MGSWVIMSDSARPQHDPDDHGDDDVQEIAEHTSKVVQPDDPMTEPPNSTVDDWFGQRVQADADRLGDAPADGDGPAEPAERRSGDQPG
jgi:hypothetical protein